MGVLTASPLTPGVAVGVGSKVFVEVGVSSRVGSEVASKVSVGIGVSSVGGTSVGTSVGGSSVGDSSVGITSSVGASWVSASPPPPVPDRKSGLAGTQAEKISDRTSSMEKNLNKLWDTLVCMVPLLITFL